MDLIVCVGDHCHLNGSEMVVRCFQKLLAAALLAGQVTLKGSFCCGQCDGAEDSDRVTIRSEGRVFFTRYEEAEDCFLGEIRPHLEALLARDAEADPADAVPRTGRSS